MWLLSLERLAVLKEEYINVELGDRIWPQSINLKETETQDNDAPLNVLMKS